MEQKTGCILMGSPRKSGNTQALLQPFTQELEKLGCQVHCLWLYDLKVLPCTACRHCQKDWSVFGCPQQDAVGEIFDLVRASDLLLLATPIYSWFCTPPMKSLLGRIHTTVQRPLLADFPPCRVVKACIPQRRAALLRLAWRKNPLKTASFQIM